VLPGAPRLNIAGRDGGQPVQAREIATLTNSS
jgi:hypothetical protein